MGVSTVEAHLSHVYRKLGIRSRAGLAVGLDQGRRLMTTAVIGREQELDAIEAFLAEAELGPRALVLSGEPGIGKTVLWEAGSSTRAAGSAPPRARSVEAEASLSFAALSDLLGDVLDDVAPRSRRRGGMRSRSPCCSRSRARRRPNPRAIGLALLDVLRALAEHGPVLVALDDLQWLDPSSAGVLQIAFRRLRDEPVGLLATVRRAPEMASAGRARALVPERAADPLVLGPLTLAALHRLLEERLGSI